MRGLRWPVIGALLGFDHVALAHTIELHTSIVNWAASGPGESTSGSSATGLVLEYSFFSTESVALRLRSQLQFDSGSMLYTGGDGGVAWHFMGGRPMSLTRPGFTLLAVPRIQGFLFGGIGVRNYDITSSLPPPKPGTTGTRTVTPRVGQFYGPAFGIGFDYYMSWEQKQTLAHFRFYQNQSLETPGQFSFSLSTIQLGIGMALN